MKNFLSGFLSEESKMILMKRIKSLAWRLGMLLAVSLVAFVSDNLSLFTLPTWAVPLISLFLSEVTKYLNSRGG